MRNLILVTTGAQGNNVVPRISQFSSRSMERVWERDGRSLSRVNRRTWTGSIQRAELSFCRLLSMCGVVRVAVIRVVEQWFAQIFGKCFLNIKTLSNTNMVASWNIKRYKRENASLPVDVRRYSGRRPSSFKFKGLFILCLQIEK